MPKPQPERASRSAGRQMRSALLDAAAALFKSHGLGAVSLAGIAEAAGAFPSQITYYFRTKEALFVEAACRDMLHLAALAERCAAAETTPAGYTAALVRSVMGTGAINLFIEAMALTRRRQDLAPLVERTFERLRHEGERAYAGQIAARGWQSSADPSTSARHFWSLAIGISLQGQATGLSPVQCAAEMLQLIGTLAAPKASPARPRLIHTGAASP